LKKFVLIGVGGYIAPQHLHAIKDTGNVLIAALDKNDSVGILDSYFPEADFFTEFERFDRHIEKMRLEKNEQIDYVSICSPNYLHDAHIRFAMRIGANAICEKPIVLNPWNIDILSKIEIEHGKKINTILQLRHHPSIVSLKQKIDISSIRRDHSNKFDIEITYITSRGSWYDNSWKGDIKKSGGIVTNIGVHFFDMLVWIFGEVKCNTVFVREERFSSGYLELEKANVKWFLSLDKEHLPIESNSTYRSIKVDGEEIEFSDGFKDLHTTSYEKILNEEGFGIVDAKPSIEIVSDIRNKELKKEKDKNKIHPMLLKI
jgi:UDP-N-acetyl-2-amino-2-deoxyglucuronate dehydrogenase